MPEWPPAGNRTDVDADLVSRVISTLIFVITTSVMVIVVAIELLISIPFIRVAGVLMGPFESEKVKKWRIRQEEHWEGWCLDSAVVFIMWTCHITGVWRIHIHGPRPNRSIGTDEWQKWQSEHARVAKEDALLVCPLPLKGPNDRNPSIESAYEVADTMHVPASCLVVSNHLSNIDGFCAKAVMFPVVTKAMIKGEAFKFPAVGQVLYFSGECFVWGGKSPQQREKYKEQLMARCAEVVRNEVPFVVYPEGTRRAYGRMAPLRLGIIKFAIDNEFPILVSVIHGSHRAWPKHSFLVKRHPIRLKFSDHVIIPRRGKDSPEKVADGILARMLDLFEGIPGYDREAERPIRTMEEYQRIIDDAEHNRKGRRKGVISGDQF